MGFFADTSGAVTVEWVVVTAASVGMGMAVMEVVSAGVEDVSRDIGGFLTDMPIMTSFSEWESYRNNGSVVAASEENMSGEYAGCTVEDGVVISCE